MATRYRHEALQLAMGSDQGKIVVTGRYVQIGQFGFKDISVTVDLAVAGAGGIEAGSSFAVSTWYRIYLITDGTGSQISGVISTGAAAPTTYPTGYTDCIYVGSANTNTSTPTRQFYRFINAAGSNWFWWNEDITASPFRVLSVTTSAGAVWTDVVCSAVVPATSRMIRAYANIVDAASGYMRARNKDLVNNHATAGSVVCMTQVANVQGYSQFFVGVDSAGTFQYSTNANTVDVYVDVSGYEDIR